VARYKGERSRWAGGLRVVVREIRLRKRSRKKGAPRPLGGEKKEEKRCLPAETGEGEFVEAEAKGVTRNRSAPFTVALGDQGGKNGGRLTSWEKGKNGRKKGTLPMWRERGQGTRCMRADEERQ